MREKSELEHRARAGVIPHDDQLGDVLGEFGG